MSEFINEYWDVLIVAIPALWLFYRSQYWPLKTEQWKAKFEASQEAKKHSRRQEDLTLAYFQSENAVAQQQTNEMLQNLVEFVQKVITVELDQVNKRLDIIEENSKSVPDIRRDVVDLKHRISDVLTYARTLINLLRDEDKI